MQNVSSYSVWIAKTYHSLGASLAAGVIAQKVGVAVDTRKGLYSKLCIAENYLLEALIAILIGLNKPFLGTGI